MTRVSPTSWQFAAILLALCASRCITGLPAQNVAQPTSDPQDLVYFFKEAVKTPPQVEHFAATQRILRQRGPPSRPEAIPSGPLPAPVSYVGRYSESNFLLQRSGASSSTNILKTVSGRWGTNSYQINDNTVVRTSETASLNPTNPIARFSDSSFATIQQIFNMGIGDLQPDSVKWSGDEFKATRNGGIFFYGRLVSSNGLPSELLLSKESGGEPYKKCTYTYASAPGSLGGYPARTVIWATFPDGLQPYLELALEALTLSDKPIPVEAFTEIRNMLTGIVYSTVYSNGSRYDVDASGRAAKMLPPPERKVQQAQPWRRRTVLFGLGVVALAAPLLVWRLRAHRSTTQ